MTAAMMAFGIATLICYLPMTRLQNRRATSGSSRDGFGWVGGADIDDGASHSSGAEMITSQPVIRALQTR
jgi:hypothetical protein